MKCETCHWFLECQNVGYQNEPCPYYQEMLSDA